MPNGAAAPLHLPPNSAGRGHVDAHAITDAFAPCKPRIPVAIMYCVLLFNSGLVGGVIVVGGWMDVELPLNLPLILKAMLGDT